MFERFDVNKDGVLDWDEIWFSCEPIYTMIRMKEFSWKATEETTADEFKDMVREMFDTSDSNKNGVLEADEFK